MLNIAICEDEAYFRDKIYTIVNEWFEHKCIEVNIDTYESGEAFIKSQTDRVDIAFLDISMEGINGIDTARKLRESNQDAYIVFITAYMEYVLKGYEVEAIRYILKDMDTFKIKLEESLAAITRKLKYPTECRQYAFIEKTKNVPLNTLIYIESNLHRLKFHIQNNRENAAEVYTLYGKLNDIEGEYEGRGFIRIHQSYIVNIGHIKNIKRYSVLMSDGSELGIPKNRYKEVERKVTEYKGEMW